MYVLLKIIWLIFTQHNYFRIHPCCVFLFIGSLLFGHTTFFISIDLFVDGHLCFVLFFLLFFGYYRETARNIQVYDFVWIYALFSLEKKPRNKMVGSHDSCVFNIVRNCQTVVHCGHSILHSHHYESFKSFSALGIVNLFHFSHSNQCVVVSYWVLILFPNDYDVENIFFLK